MSEEKIIRYGASSAVVYEGAEEKEVKQLLVEPKIFVKSDKATTEGISEFYEPKTKKSPKKKEEK